MEQDLAKFNLPAWADLPAVPLYMAQLLTFVNQTLAPLAVPATTKTMINSYVKQHFFSRPTGRQYTRNQMAAVLVVTILKQDFSLTTISQAILQIRESRAIAPRYEQFRQAFNQTLRLQPVPMPTDDALMQAITLAAQTVGTHLLTKQALS